MSNIFYIYKHTFSNGSIYIGKGKDKRANKFIQRNKYYTNTLIKYGEPIVELLYEKLNELTALDLEVVVIQQFKNSGVKLLNITEGGEGVSGFKHTPESKVQMSNSQKGKKQKPETLHKRSKSMIGKNCGKVRSIEMRQKYSEAKIGTKHSADTIHTRSESMRGKKQKLIICPHCSKEGGPGAMSLWHFDKCKLSINLNSI